MTYSTRAETRIPVSKATLVALKSFLRGGEPYDTLIRRMLISGIPKSFNIMTDDERRWVLNEELKLVGEGLTSDLEHHPLAEK